MANVRYFVMTVECVRCKTKQNIHVALRPDATLERMETIQCLQCNLISRYPFLIGFSGVHTLHSLAFIFVDVA